VRCKSASLASDADDVAAVLHARVERYAKSGGSKRRAADNLIGGLMPRALGVTEPDMVRALEDRDRALEQRARILAEQAVARGDTWMRALGPVPADPVRHERWFAGISTIAAYRERWGVEGQVPLGPDAKSIEQIGHRKRAEAAINRVTVVGRQVPVEAMSRPDTGPVAEAGVTL
jgi:hypothetical protein